MEWIKNIVCGLIETYGTRNIHELISFLEITVIKKNFVNGAKGKFFRDIFGNEYIYISSELNETEEKFILAHELGHALLHTNISVEFYFGSLIVKGKLEKEANYFAAEILIDQESIDYNFIQDLNLDQLSSYYGVPKELIEYKIKRGEI